jgi:trehalose synthase
MLNQYIGISPKSDILLLQILGEKLHKRTFLHVSSTKEGGGVAEILHRMMPMLEEIGIQTRWEVIQGDTKFFDITKKIHNALQGNIELVTDDMWKYHYEINR